MRLKQHSHLGGGWGWESVHTTRSGGDGQVFTPLEVVGKGSSKLPSDTGEVGFVFTSPEVGEVSTLLTPLEVGWDGRVFKPLEVGGKGSAVLPSDTGEVGFVFTALKVGEVSSLCSHLRK